MTKSKIITIALCASLGLLACVGPVLAQSGEQQVIITLRGQNYRLLGFVATGPEPDLDRLLAVAAATPFVAKKLPPPDGPEVMVLFKPGSDPKTAVEFFHRAESAEFSALKIGAITYPINS